MSDNLCIGDGCTEEATEGSMCLSCFENHVAHFGVCDTCGDDYELSSRDGRCGDCGNCSDCCEHYNPDDCQECGRTMPCSRHKSTCNCECGCEVPLNGGTCVDCTEGDHQNNG